MKQIETVQILEGTYVDMFVLHETNVYTADTCESDTGFYFYGMNECIGRKLFPQTRKDHFELVNKI